MSAFERKLLAAIGLVTGLGARPTKGPHPRPARYPEVASQHKNARKKSFWENYLYTNIPAAMASRSRKLIDT